MCGTANKISSGISGGVKAVTHGVTHGNLNEVISGSKQYSKAMVRAGADVATFGTAELANKAMGGRLFADNAQNGGYTPQDLPNEDPKLMLARTGGAPLLAQIAMGVEVETALAGYFGRNAGPDWDTYIQNLSPDEHAAIDNVRSQLTQVQSNTALRNQAVQQVVNDFPNLTANAAQKAKDAKQAAGEEFDTETQKYIDLALNKSAAKYAAGGGLSSGSAIEAAAKTGAEMALQKLQYTNERSDTAYNQGSTEDANTNNMALGKWNARYAEANALRSFQQKMLGQGASNGFSADQATLNRVQRTNEFNADAANKKNMATDEREAKQEDAMFGAAGSLAGTVVGGYVAGPPGAMVGSQIGANWR